MTILSNLKPGKRAKIIEITAGKGFSSQLNKMGLLIGDEIRIVQNSQGPLIVAKENLRIALGRGMSNKVFVEEL